MRDDLTAGKTDPMLSPDQTIYVAGHRGLVGAAVVRLLQERGFHNIVVASHAELDLLNQSAVTRFFESTRPDVVVFAAGKVGGIHANQSYPAEFIYENLTMGTNAIHAAWRSGTKRLMYLGSTCIYPRMAPQPLQEESLLSSPLEPTNEAYAVAKIANVKLCQFYRRQYGVTFHSVMPTNLYGPGDNYHPEESHVLPALIRRFHEAKLAKQSQVTLWGTGTPLREFLHVDDLAAAILHLLGIENPPDLINVGTGEEISILELASLVAEIVGYSGKIVTDPSRPDGTPRKLADLSRVLATGWTPVFSLKAGLINTYKAFLHEQQHQIQRVSPGEHG
ncbi:MAG: GDP-L-fucose synthase [Planctomycetota bacterium]|nr:GDP-L-fucose synthase [Planctomycetota bacterium]MDA1214861.1 GDP-L-fucose synthase [Planctomycetota bacterium]